MQEFRIDALSQSAQNTRIDCCRNKILKEQKSGYKRNRYIAKYLLSMAIFTKTWLKKSQNCYEQDITSTQKRGCKESIGGERELNDCKTVDENPRKTGVGLHLYIIHI